MSFKSGFVIGVVVIILAMLIVIGLYTVPQESGPYVTCSNYHLITDKYKTINGGYFITADSKTLQTIKTLYDRAFVGGYTKFDNEIFPITTIYMFNLTPTNETVSGYRGACMVLP